MTSGSTGTVYRFFIILCTKLIPKLADGELKIGGGNNRARLIFHLGDTLLEHKDRLSQKAKSYIMNAPLFSAFDLMEESLENIWKKIFRFKPTIIYGYPSAIFPLSVYLKETKKNTQRLG